MRHFRKKNSPRTAVPCNIMYMHSTQNRKPTRNVTDSVELRNV